MFDKSFSKWWLTRVTPFTFVSPEKLAAEHEAISRQQQYNENYHNFMKSAVLPGTDKLVKMLISSRVVHRVTSWGNQLAIRVHLSWRWGELLVSQSHEDALSFEHRIMTEGEKRGEDSSEEHTHQYDLRDPVPPSIAEQEMMFFLTRLAQDLYEVEMPEIPPNEKMPD